MTDVLRASDDEREAAIRQLTAAAAQGRLSLEELAARTERVELAVTRGELVAVTSDLPAAPVAAPSRSLARRAEAHRSLFGDLRRAGTWLVPARSRWGTWMGDVTLDLRQAQLPEGEVRISATTMFGDVQVLVPDGVEVELRAWTVLGDVVRDDAAGAPSAPRVVVRARTVFGDVRVRRRRLREALRPAG